MYEYLVWILIVVNIYFFIALRKEKKRLQILTSFIGGLIKFSSKVPEMIGDVVKRKADPDEVNGYRAVLKDIGYSFGEDFWIEPYQKFLKSDRNLFWEEHYGNGGFNQIFLDFHDKCQKEWYAINHNKDKSKENDEILGEKLIYQDFMNDKKEELKDVYIPKNPRLFFKNLSQEEMRKLEDKLGIKKI